MATIHRRSRKDESSRQHRAALNAVLVNVSKPVKGFELAHIDDVEKLVREHESNEQKE